jgi:uncharacterized protein YxeA
MKLSKPVVAVLIGLLVVFVVSVFYFYNREIRRIEEYAVNEVKTKAEAKAKAAFDKERLEFERQQEAWLEQAKVAGEAFSHKSQEAESQRKRADELRKANGSLNAAWEVKYQGLDSLYQSTLTDWELSDKMQAVAHKQEVDALSGALESAGARIVKLNLAIEGEFDISGKLVKSGYIQQLYTARAETVLAERKAKRAFWRGLAFGFIGGGALGVGVRVGL